MTEQIKKIYEAISQRINFDGLDGQSLVTWELSPVMIGDVLDYIENNISHYHPCPICGNTDIKSESFDNGLSGMQSEFSWNYCGLDDCEWDSNNREYNWSSEDVRYCAVADLVDGAFNEQVKWKDKRKPIEEQSQECIDFVHSLIPKITLGK